MEMTMCCPESMNEMLHKRTQSVKIQGENIIFIHPHTEPYRYLRVDPNFQLAPSRKKNLASSKG